MSGELQMTVYVKLQLMHLLIEKNQSLLNDMGCNNSPNKTVSVFIDDLRWWISKMNPVTLVNTSDNKKYGFKYQLGKHSRMRLIKVKVLDQVFLITVRWTQFGKNTRDSHLSNLKVGIVEYLGEGNYCPVDSNFLHAKANKLRVPHSVMFQILSKATHDLASAPSMNITKTNYGQVLMDWSRKLGVNALPHIDLYKRKEDISS